jgi:RND superfamily putative drug exporter
MAELLYRIGRFATRRRGIVVVTWLAILAVAIGAFKVAGSAPNGQITIPGTPTAQVTDRLEAAFPKAAGGSGTIVFHTKDGTPLTDAQRAAIADRIAAADTVDGAESVLDPFEAQAQREEQAVKLADGRVQIADAKAKIADGRVQIEEAKAKLADGQRQLDEGRARLVDGQAELDAAKAGLPAAQARIDAGRKQLKAGQAQLDAGKARARAGQAQLDAAKAKVKAGHAQLDSGRRQLTDGQAQLDAGKAQLVAGQAQLDAGKAQLVAQQAQLDAAIAQARLDGTYPQMAAGFAAAQAQIDAGMAQIAKQQATIDAGMAQIAAKQAQIDAGMATINARQKELNAGKATIARNQAKLDAGNALIRKNQAKIDDGLAKLVAGQRTLDAGKVTIAENQAKITDGLATIAQKQAEITDGWATIATKQAELDDAPASLATQEHKLEAGATLLRLADGIRLVSEDGSAAISMVSFTLPQTAVTKDTRHALTAVFEDAPIDGVSVDFSSSIASELPALIGPTELLGLLVAAIVLFTLLGTLVAAGLPILTALIGVGIATMGALSLSGVLVMTSVTPVLGIMLGLAVGIDYALFIVNRHRRQLKEGYSVEESIALANGTSGNAVVFAGTTVIIALIALNVTGIPFLGLMGSIGAASVAIAVLIAVTLTPALLSFAGMRVLRGKEKSKVETGVHAAPAVSRPLPTWRALGQVAIGIAVLAVLAVPAASMRLGLPVGSSEAADSTQYRAYTTVAGKFGEGQNGTLLVIADLPAGTTDDELLDHQVEVATAISAFPNVAAVAPVLTSDDHTITGFQVVPAEGPTSGTTEQLVNDIRAASPLPGGITLGVAGTTSAAIDISQKLADALPIYLGVVLGLSLLIMIVVFRSLLLPIVATGGFALSLFAALGGTVAIFQWGWLRGVFGVSDPGPILNFLPTMLAGILFGLAMDYTLFLASGMREAYAHGAPSKTAVVLGFKAGRAVVTAAAIIMVSVFGGFVFSESAMIRPIGFALAFGVLVDAFVVRMVILPGLMHLLGDAAWCLPGWLARILPNVDVEGAALERKHPHVAADPAETPDTELDPAGLEVAPA